MVYQPVVDMRDRSVIGFEALARFPTLGLPPDEVFRHAQAFGWESELDFLCLSLAVAGIIDLPDGVHLAINVTPATLANRRLPALLSHEIPRERLVLELTEHAKITDWLPMYHNLLLLRSRLVRMATNDTGAGFAGLNNIAQLMPDIIKIDRELIGGVPTSPVKRTMVEAILVLGRGLRSMVVAEGVETEDEAAWLLEMGLRFGQGWLYGEPGPLPPRNNVMLNGEEVQ